MTRQMTLTAEAVELHLWIVNDPARDAVIRDYARSPAGHKSMVAYVETCATQYCRMFCPRGTKWSDLFSQIDLFHTAALCAGHALETKVAA